MDTAGRLSSRRLRTHHYSTPGTYHLLFETEDARPLLGSVRKGVMTLSGYGQVFLAVLLTSPLQRPKQRTNLVSC